MRVHTLLIDVVVMLALAPVVSAQTLSPSAKRALTAEDYYAIERLSDPRLSPDGSLVAYVVTAIDSQRDRRRSSIWLTQTAASAVPRVLTAGIYSANSPHWISDGQAVAFLSTGDPTADTSTPAQVYLVSVARGEPRRVTSFKNGVTSFAVSPDGSKLACVVPSGPSDAQPPPPTDTRRITHLVYKSDSTGWLDDRRRHIWLVDIETGSSRQLTSGDDWDDADPEWSPDGSRLAFVSDRTGKAYEGGTNTDVWVVPASGGSPTKISDHDTADISPRWSFDGRSIAFVAALNDQSFAKIWVAPSRGGPSKAFADDLDLIYLQWEFGSPTSLPITWSGDGTAIYLLAPARGAYQVFRVDGRTHAVKPLTPRSATIHGFDVNERTRTLVYVSSDFTHPDDLYVADLSGGRERKLVESNSELLRQLGLADVERFTFKGADGWDIDGFLVKPSQLDVARTYPMILSVHGGPYGMDGFNWRHDFQFLASRGYAVLYANFRGSIGYGEKFQRAVKGEWGGKAYVDLMAGIDAALKKYPWIDRTRLGVTGMSYGGFMTNWMVGHTNQFKAAVTGAGISNPVTQEGTRYVPFPRVPDFGGTLWEAYDTYWNTAPLKYARNVTTPTLILHGERDYMVPLEQAEQWYRALKYFKVPTELVIFSRANHAGLSVQSSTGVPTDIIGALNLTVNWFDRFLKADSRGR